MHFDKIPSAIILAVLLSARMAAADITTGLVLYLPFNETNGTTSADLSTNGFTATMQNPPGDNSQWVTGRIAGAIQVNTVAPKTNQYFTIPQNSNLDFGTANAFTVSAWVATSVSSQIAGAAIIAKGTGGGNEEYDLDISATGSAGKFRLICRNPAGTSTPVIATVGPTSTFQHVAGVYDGTAHTLKIYINGVLNNTTTSAANLTALKVTSHEVSIGDRQQSTGAYNLPFIGTIDDVHLFNRALGSNDILQLYASNSGAAPPLITNQPRSVSCYLGDTPAFTVGVDQVTGIVLPPYYQWQFNGTNIANATNSALAVTNAQFANAGNYSVVVTNYAGASTSSVAVLSLQSLPPADITNNLVGYWKFDDGSGSPTAADASTNGDTGTLSGFTDGTDVSMWTTNGLIGGALIFNADASTHNVVAVPGTGSVAPAALDFAANPLFTLAAWVNGSNVQSSSASIIGHGTASGGEQYVVDINGGHFRFFVRNANGTSGYSAVSTIAPSGIWQHLAAVFNATNGILNLYVNGQLAGVGIAPFSLNSAPHEMSIGNRQGSGGAYTSGFTGMIDEVHVYNRDLTSADVQALYLAGGAYPPAILTQPAGVSLYAGDNFKLSSTASGTAPLAYQWQLNGTNVAGATTTSLIYAPSSATNAGNYTLVVTNLYGAATSSVATVTLAPFALTNALAAWWKFDDGSGSATAMDSSTNGNNGNLENFPDFTSEWVTGRAGTSAINFNNGASGQYVDIPTAPDLNFNTNLVFSISAWVRGSASQVSGADIICKGYGGNNEEYALDVSAGAYRFYVRNAAGASTPVLSAVSPNGDWQHLVATVDVNFNTMNLYVNGQLAVSGAAPASLLGENNHDVTIGCREQSTSSGYNLPFAGTIDDVRLYSRALSSNDVQTLYQSYGVLVPVFYTQPLGASLYVSNQVTFSAFVDGTAPLSYQWLKGGTNISGATTSSLTLTNLQLADAGIYNLQVSNSGGTNTSQNAILQVGFFGITNMVGYWALDETNGTTAYDSTTNGDSGTLMNFPGDNSEWVPGRIAGGLACDTNGSSQTYVSIPDSANLNFTNLLGFTLAAWVRGPAAQINGAGIIAKGIGGGGEQYAMDIFPVLLPAPTYRFYVRNSAGTSSPVYTTVAPDGRWQHLVATYNGIAGVMDFYVNGQLVASNLNAPSSLLPSSHVVSLGGREQSSSSGYNLNFQGVLDDVRIYNQVLSPALVQSLYQLAAPLPLVFYTQPQSATNYTGSSVTFSPVADGADNLGYQWFKNSNSLAGATNLTLTLTNLAVTDSGAYSLLVTNASGSLFSSNATLLVVSVNFSGSPVQLGDGTFQLNFTGPPNGSYRIFATTNVATPFAQWNQLTGGDFDGNGQAVFTDSNATNFPAQFYRISVP